jgi:hypothetical protein
LKKHNNSRKNSELTSKRAKSRGPVQRDTKEVLAELVEKLKEKLDPKKVAATSAGEKHPSCELRPNLDRLTVGVECGDCCGEPETLADPRLAPLPPDEMGRAAKAWSRPVQEPDDQPWWFHDEGGLHPSSLISGSSSLLMLGLQGRCLIPVIGRQGTPQMFHGSASSIPQSNGFFGSI